MSTQRTPSLPISKRIVQCTHVLCSCAFALLLACGDDARPATVSSDFGNEGKGEDGGPVNGNPKPSLEDAGMHVISSGQTDLCVYDDSDRFVIAHGVRTSVLSSAATSVGFGLGFARSDGALFVSAIGKQGAAKDPVAVAAAVEQAEGAQLYADTRHFLLAFRTSRALMLRDLLHPEAPATMLTGNLAVAADGGEVWALASGAAGYTAAWLQGDAAEPTLVGRTVSSAGEATGTLTTLPRHAGRSATRLSLARMQDGSLLLAWKQNDADKVPAVLGQHFSATFAALGEVTTLSKTPVADGAFSFQARRDSAGLLYPALDGGARRALKLRRIADTGEPDGPVLNVANAPRVVQNGSITPFGRGYALVYRELPSTHTAVAQIRIAFINPFGDVVYDAMLAESSDTDAATTVSAEEGEDVLVSYIEAGAMGPEIKAIRMICPGALVLCGGNLE